MKARIFTLLFLATLLLGCTSKNTKIMKPYVIEIVTFKIKPSINTSDFWMEDAKIQKNYTSQQPGFINRESGFSNDENEVLVVVKWESSTDAETSMQKFMKDKSVIDFVNMIEPNTMQMKRYELK